MVISERLQVIWTFAPLFGILSNSIEAFFLSSNVFPIKVPNPKPDLFLIFFDLLEIYGSPMNFITSDG